MSTPESLSTPAQLNNPGRILSFFSLTSWILFLPSHATAQLYSLSIGLRNDFGYFGTASQGDKSDSRYYSQFYDAAINGYVLDGRFLQFNLSSSFTDRSTSGRSSSVEISQKDRYVGYYNASVTLFPSNHYPLTIFSSRSDVLNSGSNGTYGFVTPLSPTISELTTHGLQWSIARNTYFPQMILRLQRNRQNTLGAYSWNQKNDNLSVDLSNSSANGRSNYSFSASVINNTSERSSGDAAFTSSAFGTRIDWRERQLRFSAGSALSDDFNLQANAQYYIWSRSTQQIADLTGRWQQSSTATHHMKVQLTENSAGSERNARFGSLGISDQMSLQISNKLQGTFGASHMSQFRRISGNRDEFQRENLSATFSYTGDLSFMDFTADAGGDIGLEGFVGSTRRLSHRSIAGLQGSSHLWNVVRIIGSERFAYSNNYYIGRSIQNNFFLKASANVLPQSTVDAEGSHSYVRNIDLAYFGTVQTTQLIGTVRTQALPGLLTEFRYAHQWIVSLFPDQISQVGVSITQRNFIRNLFGQFSANRQYFKRTHLLLNRIEAFVGYQFYAFSLRLRATLWSQEGFRTQGISLDITRPFSFDFR